MRYTEYKSTTIKWLKPIPSHWKEFRGKNLYRKESRTPREQDDIVTCFRDGQVTLRRNRRTEGFTESLKEIGYQGVRKGDLVIHVMDAFAGSIGVSDSDGKSTPVYSVCTAKGDTNNYYFGYLLREMARTGYIQSLYRGIRERSSDFRFDVFAAQTYPVPPREEQDQIVRYLDWQISRINKLIHGYQREISLLQERRQSIIDIATTQGIDDAELKESGTHWVKHIPKHWEMVYSKKLFAERKDKAFPGDEQLTASQKYGIIPQRVFMEREGRRVTVVMTGSDILKHVGKGDFVLSMRSFQGGLEYSHVEGKISSAYVMLIPREGRVYDEYFKWLLKSRQYIKALQGTADLVRDGQALRYANFAKVPLPIVPLDEQKRIADHIECETVKIDNAIPKIQKEINLLREYRTRLISDVVTGQIDVRGVAIPEYELEVDNTDMESGEDVEAEE